MTLNTCDRVHLNLIISPSLGIIISHRSPQIIEPLAHAEREREREITRRRGRTVRNGETGTVQEKKTFVYILSLTIMLHFRGNGLLNTFLLLRMSLPAARTHGQMPCGRPGHLWQPCKLPSRTGVKEK